ncbi:MAG: hypothetical protein JWN32_1252 [Solirubrobacterales bacterium]|nr:hypothetical protein [Solirubrobacterales bacterium]
MTYRLRAVVAALAVAICVLALAACGGGNKSSSSSGSGGNSATSLIDDTFSGKHSVKSGNVTVQLDLNLQGGGSSGLSGPITLKLGGPFASQGGKQLPKFAFDLTVGAGGQTFNAGLATDAKAAVVKFQGTNYSIPANVYSQFKQGFDQAQAKAPKSSGGTSLKQLGVDPLKLIQNPKVVGDEDVAGTTTTHVTAPVNVDGIISAVDTLLGKAGSLGVPQTQGVPKKLTDAQKQQLRQAIKSASIDVWTGKDDHTFRKLQIKASVAPGGTGANSVKAADFTLSVQLAEVNQTQTITLPTSTKPITDLTSQLGGLGGALGGLGGSSSGSGSGSSGGSSGSGAGATKNLQKYESCIQKAGTDLTKAQKCASLLTG